MAINFKDGVILAADSRTTTGAYIANRVTDKLTQVHDTIWCCRSGSAADTQAVADIVQYHLQMYGTTNDEAPTTQTAAAIFQELCYSNKDSSSLAGTTSMVVRSTRSHSEAPCTSKRTRSAVRGLHTSTDTATQTGGSR
jgi:20S proteasome alpha/beta subunit